MVVVGKAQSSTLFNLFHLQKSHRDHQSLVVQEREWHINNSYATSVIHPSIHPSNGIVSIPDPLDLLVVIQSETVLFPSAGPFPRPICLMSMLSCYAAAVPCFPFIHPSRTEASGAALLYLVSQNEKLHKNPFRLTHH